MSDFSFSTQIHGIKKISIKSYLVAKGKTYWVKVVFCDIGSENSIAFCFNEDKPVIKVENNIIVIERREGNE